MLGFMLAGVAASMPKLAPDTINVSDQTASKISIVPADAYAGMKLTSGGRVQTAESDTAMTYVNSGTWSSNLPPTGSYEARRTSAWSVDTPDTSDFADTVTWYALSSDRIVAENTWTGIPTVKDSSATFEIRQVGTTIVLWTGTLTVYAETTS